MSEEKGLNFLEEIIEKDIAEGKHRTIVTRFPPEPNGYLHLGHAKSICLNFGLSLKYGGGTNLRFDDTNPVTEETEYVENIKSDVKWLGFTWAHELYASDYFPQLFEFALKLIRKGLAYVDDSSSEEIAKGKGTPTQPGKDSPFRSRSVDENLKLFAAMKEGKFKDGEKVLRAKVDMAHVNMHMRDPIIYRIKHADHHRTGSTWCVYPMYDFAHGQSDSIENVTHSICTLEFVPHRELYDWFIGKLEIYPSRQYEFARLNMTYTIMSKRKLLKLVEEGHVNGWDDPRMPTISGMRRRGYTPEAIRDFCNRIGVARRDNTIDFELLEHCVRDHLNKVARRKMVVFDPVKVVITNYPDGGKEVLPGDADPLSEQSIPFSREIFIEREDFMENPPKDYFRLSPGKMVRLKSAYIIQCDEVVKGPGEKIEEVRCSYIRESKSGSDVSGLKVKGVIHWVNAENPTEIVVRMYDRLFRVENPALIDENIMDCLNPNSLTEPDYKIYANSGFRPESNLEEHFQFLRKGYFSLDKDSNPEKLIFNQTVTLRDTWAKKS